MEIQLEGWPPAFLKRLMISSVLWFEKVKIILTGLTGVEKRYGFSIFFVREDQISGEGNCSYTALR